MGRKGKNGVQRTISLFPSNQLCVLLLKSLLHVPFVARHKRRLRSMMPRSGDRDVHTLFRLSSVDETRRGGFFEGVGRGTGGGQLRPG
jgi:hypothetical protein